MSFARLLSDEAWALKELYDLGGDIKLKRKKMAHLMVMVRRASYTIAELSWNIRRRHKRTSELEREVRVLEIALLEAKAEAKERHKWEGKARYLEDLPACRLQFPDGSVPGGTEEALQGWKLLAELAIRELPLETGELVEGRWRQRLAEQAETT